MWQATRAQSLIVWATTLLLVLAWPPSTTSSGRSLGVKIVNWAVDPAGSLPSLPPPLPMGLDDDGDAVAAHDLLEAEYYRARDASATNRWRMRVKDARDPMDPTTERQILIGIAAVSALIVWRLSARPSA
ncbi:MAG TPA: hypothetical protein VKH42_02550 [Vicinamibacterales bacterium]|nr:hypothetical protein [Vicinamibacterales bacterium]